jgi:VanZ family protein
MTPGAGRRSTLARQACAVYAALIVYASLYPLTGWRSLGVGPFAYVLAPMPRYVTAFDVVTNVLGYLPLGALAVLALHPRWRGVRAVLAAGALGALLSATLEALQTYLPVRVSSNLDLAANAGGAFVGALLAAPVAGALIERGVLRRLRDAWFDADASTPLFIAALWPFAVLFPSPWLFGLGDWPAALWSRADAQMRGALLAWLPAGWQVSAWPARLDGWLTASGWDALVAGLGLTGALLLGSLTMRASAPRARLLAGYAVLALALKAAVAVLQARGGLRFEWAAPGAWLGIVVALGVAWLALPLARPARVGLATAALLAALALVNLLPVDPFFDFALSDWRQGRYVHFNEIARWLAWSWPYAALLWLATQIERGWLGRRG